MIFRPFASVARKISPARLRPTGYLENLVRARTHGRIWSGPFTGMCYIGNAASNARIHIPKLLGIYEREVNPHIEQACALNFPLIVNVGAAEGYYAVGMARRNPMARVIAFEMDAGSRAALAETIKLNDVGNRVEIRGKCEPEDLERALADTPRPLVICDVEGYESVLLDPLSVPSLRRTWILVELHEFVERGISDKMADFPFGSLYTLCLPKSYLHWAVSESRPERMSWFWMKPLAGEDRRLKFVFHLPWHR
jgi:hypothetical protein